MLVSVDGKITDEKNACFPVVSDAFLYGVAVFETIRTYNGKIFRFDDHLARLFVSTDVIDLKSPWTFKKVYKQVVDVLNKNKHKNVKIRIILTKRHLVVTVEKLKEKPEQWYKKGVKMVSFLGRRNIPRAKILADCFLHLAKKHAEACGAYEALLVDPKKFYVREGAYSNIFWVNDGDLYATNKNIFFGMTRDTVVELAKKDLKVYFEGVKLKSLLSADEVFMTQTTSGILPVVEIDGHKIGTGRPGPVTKKLMKQFNQLVWGK
ncbi:aminotransferase class IV [candidate division KSB1 bacterium]